jgi:serine/threonine protein kinase
MPPRSTHPTREQLAAFVHGQLSDDDLRVLETHVAQCETCCEELRHVPHDNLVERLRSASSMSGQAVAAITEFPSLDGSSDDESLSPLANHARYEVIRELGKGGMGIVYLAQHRVMGRLVALKVINRRLLRNQMAVERFQLEVQSAARLNHRNIVTAFDAEQAGDLHFLVMEYVEGTDLATTVSRHGQLPVVYACNYIMQAAQGLQHAHEQGMVHRDIKPQNLMRTRKGTVKILDFGLARLASPSESDAPAAAGLTVEGVTLGTPDYIAPEQARDSRRADIRSDIYSLGCTLYFLLTGSVPYPTGTIVEKVLAHCTGDPASVRSFRSDLPDALVDIIERMMARDPAARFQTPAEVAAALKPFSQPGTAGSNPITSNPLPEESTRLATDATRVDFSSKSSAGGISFRAASMPAWKQWQWQVVALGLAVCIGLLAIPFNGINRNRQSDADQNLIVTHSGPSTPSSSTSGEGTWIDLIAKIKPNDENSVGTWRQKSGELTVNAEESARIALPYTPPVEYDLDIEFTRHTGTLSIAVIFAAGSGLATFELDAWGRHLGGIQLIDGRNLQQQTTGAVQLPLNNGQRYRLRMQVRRDRVVATLDGRTLTTYVGNGSNLQPLELWRLPGNAPLGVGAYTADTTFHTIRIRPVAAATRDK